jgi:photosystem II stability/assembly factor-like uncharacterized protein
MFKNRYITQLLCIAFLCGSLFLAFNSAYAQSPPDKIDEAIFKGLKWRCIGPANMGGRIDDFAVVEAQPYIIYVGTASGGVWKTINNGITWESIFAEQNSSSIGDIALAPSNPSIVWVGTGEANSRQSSSWGDGVYKSNDAGKTWKHMGLKETHHIGRIAIHPHNPDIVYVAGLGHLWGANEERGLFRTTDGGTTWKKVLYVDENTGCVDVAINPENPEILYAATYQHMRKGWGFNGGGPGSGLYRSIDGGETWTKLTNGLPTGNTGRIGIDIYYSNPNIVYATIEHKKGGVFRSEDKGLTWKKMSDTNPRPMYYSQIRIDPNNDQRIWVLGSPMYYSEDGGKTFNTNLVTSIHVDHHALWIDSGNSNHMILGCDGGINISYDRGKTWDFVNTIPIGQFYEISFDMRKPYYVYGGLQDNGVWGGPSATRYKKGITNSDWYQVHGWDGFYAQADPTDPNIVYAEAQSGRLYRFNLKINEYKYIMPLPEKKDERYKFNWNSPLLISPHDAKTLYYGGNMLFKSTDRGETWTASIDLTTQQDMKKMKIMGVLPSEDVLSLNDGISCYGDITTISESPLKKGLLYVGTDDGNLQISQDDGKTWKNVISKVPNIPKYTYVSRVVASRFAEGRAYATFDGHRNDDFKAYVYVTENNGENWKSIAGNLPEGGTVNVIREHYRNPNLLFVGTERGAYVSFDRGGNWIKIKSNFPICPVDDIAIHPRENDLIFGTHGCSIWILDDITPLEKLSKEILDSDYYLFSPRPATLFIPYEIRETLGNKLFVGKNPPYGALISYYLKSAPKKAEKETKNKDKKELSETESNSKDTGVKITILDKSGAVIRELEGTNEVGINRINWDLRYAPSVKPGKEERDFMGPPEGPFVLPGEYIIKLAVAGKEATQNLVVEAAHISDIALDERKAQQQAIFKLNEIYAVTHEASEAVENILKQIDVLKNNLKKVKEVPESITTAIDAISKEAKDLKKEIKGDRNFWLREEYPIIYTINNLYYCINSYSGAPTQGQNKQIVMVENELKPLVERLNTLVDKTIPDLNKQMYSSNIPILMPPKLIKTKK